MSDSVSRDGLYKIHYPSGIILPYLKYKTQDDDKVRKSHALLHNVSKHIDDPFWDEFYPPNGWNCRCYTLQTAGQGTKTEPDRLPDDKEVPQIFRRNAGKSGVVFEKDHPYYEGIPKGDIRNILNAQREILVGEDIYDFYSDQVKAHITHDGQELADNLDLAKK